MGAVVALLALACNADERSRTQGDRLIAIDAIVTVSNEGDARAVVTLVADTLRLPLGEVDARDRRSFSLPITVVKAQTPLHLEAAGGVRTVRSVAFAIQRGDRIVWTLDRKRHGTIAKQ